MPKAEIVKIEGLTRSDIAWSIRLFGSGGVFGYFGIFSNKTLGKMTWYVTNRNNPVLIKMTSGKKIVVSPHEPVAFLNAYKS